MKPKILVVDNHPMILKFMTDLLQKEGYQVKSAEDGLSALDVMGSYTPDIMFIDLVMPNISGEKLCRIVRSNPKYRHVFICILSAIAAEQEVDYTQFEANACIAKGPLNKMAQYVLSVLQDARSRSLPTGRGKTIGLDEVYKRHITKELLHSKRHFETIIGNMSQGILELNSDGRIVYVNALGLSLIGVSEVALLGTHFSDLFQGEQNHTVRELLRTGLEGPVSLSEDSPLFLNEREITLNLIPVKDEKRVSMIVILDDVSQRRRMKLELIQAQKMKAISTLAGGIAHEFNNALQGIAGNLDLLELKLYDRQQMEKFVYPMKSSIERMSSLIDQLLAYAQGGKYQPKLISLNSIIEDTLRTVQHTLGRHISIEKCLGQDLYSVEADMAQLQMVLLAVLNNAEEAIEGEGKIRIVTKNVEINEKSIKNQFEVHPGPYACICIEDNGKGMDEVTRLRIFEPFFTTKFHGRGFGMAAVYGIVKNHNGWIDISSSAEEGTSICIYLPAAAKSKESKPDIEVFETVLVIEDEEPVLQVTADMLETIGYKVLMARSGRDAVEFVQKYKDQIHAAILDLGLPDMSGSNVFHKLREARAEIKILISSGYALDDPAQEMLNRGADGFLQKPYTLSTLSSKLKELLVKG
jgi:two-component system cell cycle sensor histidine kinase/response regulator CckA